MNRYARGDLIDSQFIAAFVTKIMRGVYPNSTTANTMTLVLLAAISTKTAGWVSGWFFA